MSPDKQDEVVSEGNDTISGVQPDKPYSLLDGTLKFLRSQFPLRDILADPQKADELRELEQMLKFHWSLAERIKGHIAARQQKISPEEVELKIKLNTDGLCLLRDGNVREFNELREQNPRWCPDFASADLSGIKIPGINLSGAVLRGATLSGADLSGAKLYYATLTGAKLIVTNLSGADLTGSFLIIANCTDVNLTNALLLNTDCLNARFINARLGGADFDGAHLSGADFTGADITGTKFIGAETHNIEICRS